MWGERGCKPQSVWRGTWPPPTQPFPKPQDHSGGPGAALSIEAVRGEPLPRLVSEAHTAGVGRALAFQWLCPPPARVGAKLGPGGLGVARKSSAACRGCVGDVAANVRVWPRRGSHRQIRLLLMSSPCWPTGSVSPAARSTALRRCPPSIWSHLPFRGFDLRHSGIALLFAHHTHFLQKP